MSGGLELVVAQVDPTSFIWGFFVAIVVIVAWFLVRRWL